MKIFLDTNICLDLLDTKRPTSLNSIDFYKKNIDNEFYFSGDFITTFYYVMTERKKYDKKETIKAIDLLSKRITPIYIEHNDFLNAQIDFFSNFLDDFEDLIILNSSLRLNCNSFITNDKKLNSLKVFKSLKIIKP